MIFPKLHKALQDSKNIDKYFIALDNLGSNVSGTRELSNELSRLIFDQIVKPEKNINGTKKFINEFEASSGDIIYEAYNFAIELENNDLEQLYKKRTKEGAGYFSSINDEEKNKIAERIARQIYIEAVQAKENDDNITFAIQYYIVTNNALFSQTEASFNLFRDKEMKSFFKKEFTDLKNVNRKASSRLVHKISELSKVFEESLNNLSSSLATEEESQDDIDKQNHRFLMQSYIFDRSYKTDGER